MTASGPLPGSVEESTAFIGIGSNLGDKVEAFITVLGKLKILEKSRLTAVSSLYETSPVGLEGGPFLNAVAVIETRLGPNELLEKLLSMEATLGRTRKHGGTDARIIDLDLLLYDDTVVEGNGLILPHPRMLLRRFVMEPLAELVPDLVIPPTGITASEAAKALEKNHPEQKVRRVGTLEEVKIADSLKLNADS